jgi:tetratricopeptide (TPR) repeat protein
MRIEHRWWSFVIVALGAVLAQPSAAEIPGWQNDWPTPQQMLQGRDPTQVQQFINWSAALEKNPKDTTALDNRAYLDMAFAKKGLYGSFWRWLAAKDLEQATQLNPNDFYAWHNYGDLNYNSGDLWMMNDHSNAQRAVTAFTHAIALNPQSARSYMGRGWAYLTMDDQAHANADFQAALRLDPSLRPSLEKEVASIYERKNQEAGARGTIQQMGRYVVEQTAHNKEECDKFIGYWTNGECRISQALNPGPVQPYEGQLRGGGGSLR